MQQYGLYGRLAAPTTVDVSTLPARWWLEVPQRQRLASSQNEWPPIAKIAVEWPHVTGAPWPKSDSMRCHGCNTPSCIAIGPGDAVAACRSKTDGLGAQFVLRMMLFLQACRTKGVYYNTHMPPAHMDGNPGYAATADAFFNLTPPSMYASEPDWHKQHLGPENRCGFKRDPNATTGYPGFEGKASRPARPSAAHLASERAEKAARANQGHASRQQRHAPKLLQSTNTAPPNLYDDECYARLLARLPPSVEERWSARDRDGVAVHIRRGDRSAGDHKRATNHTQVGRPPFFGGVRGVPVATAPIPLDQNRKTFSEMKFFRHHRRS